MAIPNFPELEEQILKDWDDKQIFKKTLGQPAPQGRFVFYDGPPTANGTPHIGHVETRAFKDIIPRFKTMQGYRVERKAGWDTQGLPVELEVEKDLGISGKKDIEKFGIAEFNTKAKTSVWKYKDLWEQMTRRIGFWLDLDHPYITYEPEYIETLWWIFRQAWDKKLLVQDYKVVPYCPRCGTALSSHEVAQGYENVTEPSVYIKFELIDEPGTFVLAWTTTPWTLPGNVALAVKKDATYKKLEVVEPGTWGAVKGDKIILEVDCARRLFGVGGVLEGAEFGGPKQYIDGLTAKDVGQLMRGSDLVGLKYKPLFDFLDLRIVVSTTPSRPQARRDTPPRKGGDQYENAYTIVPADFVTTEDGTGVVHTAVMYGIDDFELGKKLDLPKVHTVDEQGKFNELVKPWAGLEVKDTKGETQQKIIVWLKEHGKLYKVENYAHDYPFCWRCKHALLYYAKTSWFILMSKLRDQLIANNEQISWYPSHIQEGRFGEWLREVKDWAISRERYWGTPIPIWECQQCQHQHCLGSYEELTKLVPTRNRFIFIRHGESTNNITETLDTEISDGTAGLTDLGRTQAEKAAKELKKENIEVIISSQFARAKETADIIGRELKVDVTVDPRVNEYHIGPDYEGKTIEQFHQGFGDRAARLHEAPPGGETWLQIRARMFAVMHELDAKYSGKTILIATHSDPIYVVRWALSLQPESVLHNVPLLDNAKPIELPFPATLYQHDGSFDPHRPFIDAVTFPCPSCKQGTMRRIPEVADAWFDSGSMPFAQWHYPFENKEKVDNGEAYPADYISEAIDQTRGWFYTLLAVATLLEHTAPPYKNVVVLGFINDAHGKKLSKSLGNYIDPMELINKHGADPVRWYMYTVNQPWDSKDFDPNVVDEGVKKTFLILLNVLSFWKMYAAEQTFEPVEPKHILDRWITNLTNDVVRDVTDRLERYDITGAGRRLAEHITDLSTWYVRRSRDRFKGDDAQAAIVTLHSALLTLSKLMAPFTPFLAEHVYREIGGGLESVHLEAWPQATIVDDHLLSDMKDLRQIVEQGHALRARAGLKVRQPLGQAVLNRTLRLEFIEILKDEMNVKEVKEDAKLETLPTEYTRFDDQAMIALDTTITDELKEEGMLRDLVREVNALRKTAKLVPTDVIVFHIEPGTIGAQLVERYGQQFLKDVRAKAATPSLDGATHTAEIELDRTTLTIGLSVG